MHNFGKPGPLHGSGDGIVVGGVTLGVVVPDGHVGDLLDQPRLELGALRQPVAGVSLENESHVAFGHRHRVA